MNSIANGYLLIGLSSFIVLYGLGYVKAFENSILEDERLIPALYLNAEGLYVALSLIVFTITVLLWPLAWFDYVCDDE